MYTSFAYKYRVATPGFGLAPPGRAGILSVNGNVTLDMAATGLSPYLIGGVGYYRLSSDNSPSEGQVGLNGGIGVRFGLAGLSAFAETRYHDIIVGNSSNFSLNGSSSVNLIPVALGITF
ncbi:MAG: hypothetical protein NVS4B3_21850 [Gemmatimonadaceae bacterium]